MSQTRAALINQALVNLGIVAEGQSVEAEDVNKMDAIVDPLIAELSGLEIYYVDDAGSVGPTGGVIDDGAFLSIAACLANASASAFNLAADQKMAALAMLAEAKLTTLSRPARTLRTLNVDAGARVNRILTYNGTF